MLPRSNNGLKPKPVPSKMPLHGGKPKLLLLKTNDSFKLLRKNFKLLKKLNVNPHPRRPLPALRRPQLN